MGWSCVSALARCDSATRSTLVDSSLFTVASFFRSHSNAFDSQLVNEMQRIKLHWLSLDSTSKVRYFDLIGWTLDTHVSNYGLTVRVSIHLMNYNS